MMNQKIEITGEGNYWGTPNLKSIQEKLDILKHWKEDKSILQISKLTDIPRDKVIDVIQKYIHNEFEGNFLN